MNCQGVIGVAQHVNPRLHIMAAVTIDRDLQYPSFKVHTVVLSHRPLETLAQDVIQYR